MKDKEKICARCGMKIFDDERWVLLGTYENKKTLEENYFHIACWREFFKEKVIATAKRNIKATHDKVVYAAKKMLGGM